MRLAKLYVTALLIIGGSSSVSNLYAQTSLLGSEMILNSSGSPTLSGPDYLGTYLVVPAGGATINFTLDATQGEGVPGGLAPNMNIVVADTKFGLTVNSTSGAEYSTGNVVLPSGTYVVRAERGYVGPAATSPYSVTVNNLAVNTVSGSPAAFSNVNTDASALDAAHTYIDNFRRGPAALLLVGAAPGTPVTVSMVRNEFNFGTAVSGNTRSTSSSSDSFLYSGNTNPQRTPYREHLLENFNAIVPENAGKWSNQESGNTQPAVPNMDYVNDILNYAQFNDLRTRMHTMLWDSQSQQPTWVNNLVNSSNTAGLTNAVNNRIKYYIGDSNDGNPNDDPAQKYVALDVLNEHLHQPAYLNLYGASGIANIYNQVAAAAASVGANVGLFTNEYNVLLDGADNYGNWYRDSIESIRDAGGSVGGIGVQYYVRVAGHSPAKVMQTIQNLSVDGLPITLTEFGVQDGAASMGIAPDILEQTLALAFGSANADGFFMWGFWQGNIYSQAFASALYTADWTLTPTGVKWQQLMSEWTTPTTILQVGPDGKIDFAGFYGDYELLIGGKHYSLSLVKGTADYEIVVPEPASLALLTLAMLAIVPVARHQRGAASGRFSSTKSAQSKSSDKARAMS